MNRTIILLFILLSFGFSHNLQAQCTHTISLTDTYGDGWNSGTVSVTVNGASVLTNITMTGGSGPDNFTFSATTGDVINVELTNGGGYPAEMRIELFDGVSNTIISLQQPIVAPGLNGAGFCSNPDSPCGASNLIMCTTRLDATNSGMTNSSIAAPSCGNYAGGDVWFITTVPASGEVQVEGISNSLTDMAMAMYTESGGCSGTFTEIACDANSADGNMPFINQTGLTVGSTVYIRMWDEFNDATGTFQVQARDLSSLFCFTGDAVDMGTGCGQLTAAVNDQVGTIWDSDDLLDFNSDFTHDFTVNLGTSDGGADGMAFVIQNDPAGLAASGDAGGSLGAGGISNSLIIEIDTYLNTEDRDDGITGVTCSGGPEPDHLDIWLNGSVNPYADCSWQGPGARVIANAERLETGGSLYNIENGLDHVLRISYTSATQTLNAEILNQAGTISYGIVTYSPCVANTIFGTTTPYFGFTASTGGLNNQQTGCLAQSFNSPLPVEMSRIDLICKDGYVNLNWETAAEINNDYFVIEASTNGVGYDELAKVNGAGTTMETTEYSYIYENTNNGYSYFRITQVDFNGAIDISKTIYNECIKKGQEFSFYPNPSSQRITIQYPDFGHAEARLIITNGIGSLVKVIDLSNTYSNSLSNLDTRNLLEGFYMLTLETSTSIHSKKLIIKR